MIDNRTCIFCGIKSPRGNFDIGGKRITVMWADLRGSEMYYRRCGVIDIANKIRSCNISFCTRCGWNYSEKMNFGLDDSWAGILALIQNILEDPDILYSL